MQEEQAIIIGAGPCGMSAAIALQDKGINPLLIEKGNVVNAIYQYPTHQTFFSSSDRLEIGEIPFITEFKKPVRNQALAYYREVARRRELRINSYERVVKVKHEDGAYLLYTETNNGSQNVYKAGFVIAATGYYDQPNEMGIKGEELSHVSHYFKESHPYYNKNVVVIGGKNSAVDAALELHKAGAHITVLYRGSDYSDSIKPWILPEFVALASKGRITMEFNAIITEIKKDTVDFTVHTQRKHAKADFVFAMTGYQPDQSFLREMAIEVDIATGRPVFNQETMETNVENIYIAGVIAAGFNNNEIFIENGRFHGPLIAEDIAKKIKKRMK
ncbi:YpdA family putative bacillithiol disulfide reductase [Paraliobacillus sp. X-1268]|uniref:YpdA family putative bacillithiol disulfide reductase n=1 Tax=Paraliobacillus sp. X-1268 TaxID=2213193 RepID=UPI000E3E7AB6|nr:YpdA family putative bacillithiol disulfide reductase [Paraliobacillus sp. X-1268]